MKAITVLRYLWLLGIAWPIALAITFSMLVSVVLAAVTL